MFFPAFQQGEIPLDNACLLGNLGLTEAGLLTALAQPLA
jgi:hypothetical protein